MSRLDAWEYAINVASARVTGGGLSSWSGENYARYGVPTPHPFVAHSIYFSVLNDSGWPGLFLLLLVLLLVWRQLGRAIAVTNDNPEYADHNYLARMLQVSLIAFMAGGAFLSLAYFDLAWHIMAITIAMTELTKGLSEKQGGGKKVKERPNRAGTYRRRRRFPGKP